MRSKVVETQLLSELEKTLYSGIIGRLETEVFGDEEPLVDWAVSDLLPKEGEASLPLIRKYVERDGRHMLAVVCTDEQLQKFRSSRVTTELVSENGRLKTSLGMINVFMTETGDHSLDPMEDKPATYYVTGYRSPGERYGLDWDYSFDLSAGSYAGSIVHRLNKYRAARHVYGDWTMDVLLPVSPDFDYMDEDEY